jgi:hypothetical protein
MSPWSTLVTATAVANGRHYCQASSRHLAVRALISYQGLALVLESVRAQMMLWGLHPLRQIDLVGCA